MKEHNANLLKVSYFPVYVIAMVLFDEDEQRLFCDNVFEEEKRQSINSAMEEIFEDEVHSFSKGEMIEPIFQNINGEHRSLHNLNRFIVFYAENNPDPFRAVYTRKSLIAEFRMKYGNFLPSDFMYEDHIGVLSGVLWG